MLFSVGCATSYLPWLVPLFLAFFLLLLLSSVIDFQLNQRKLRSVRAPHTRTNVECMKKLAHRTWIYVVGARYVILWEGRSWKSWNREESIRCGIVCCGRLPSVVCRWAAIHRHIHLNSQRYDCHAEWDWLFNIYCSLALVFCQYTELRTLSKCDSVRACVCLGSIATRCLQLYTSAIRPQNNVVCNSHTRQQSSQSKYNFADGLWTEWKKGTQITHKLHDWP